MFRLFCLFIQPYFFLIFMIIEFHIFSNFDFKPYRFIRSGKFVNCVLVWKSLVLKMRIVRFSGALLSIRGQTTIAQLNNLPKPWNRIYSVNKLLIFAYFYMNKIVVSLAEKNHVSVKWKNEKQKQNKNQHNSI